MDTTMSATGAESGQELGISNLNLNFPLLQIAAINCPARERLIIFRADKAGIECNPRQPTGIHGQTDQRMRKVARTRGTSFPLVIRVICDERGSAYRDVCTLSLLGKD